MILTKFCVTLCYDEHKNNLAVKDIISHIYKDATGQWKIQTNAEHSNNVAKLARSFADELGMGMWGYVLGMLHDKGKESDAFQSYTRKESGYDYEAKCPLEHNHTFVACNSVNGRLDIFLNTLSKGLRWITKG